MQFKDTDTLLRPNFLSQHRQAIREAYQRHRAETGYVFLTADKSLQAAEAPRFVQRGFNRL